VRQPNKSSWEGWLAYAWSGGWAVPTGVLRPSLGQSTGTDLAKSLESHVAHRPHTATHPTGGVDAPTGASPGNGVVAATPRSSSRQHTHGRVEATPLHLTRRGWGLGYSTGAAALGRQQPRTLTSSSVAVFVVAPLVLGPPTLLPHTGAGLLACVATTVALDRCPLLHCYSGDGCTCFSHRASCAAEAPSPCRVHSRSDGHTWLLSGRARPGAAVFLAEKRKAGWVL
jgi:hypothetical protein